MVMQIVIANEEDPGQHEAHSRGLAALLGVGNTPVDFLSNDFFLHKVSKNTKSLVIDFIALNVRRLILLALLKGVFSVPALDGPGPSLNTLCTELKATWNELGLAEVDTDLRELYFKCVLLDCQFDFWQRSREHEFKPVTIGQCKNTARPEKRSQVPVGFWPGQVDMYFDNYVAGVWNVFRAARLFLVSMIHKLSDQLGLESDEGQGSSHFDVAREVAKDIIASIPYHLTDNLQTFMLTVDTAHDIEDTGRYLGGLLLMHPLFIASKISCLDDEMRAYFKRCLVWIGDRMGFGHANLLAKVSLYPPTFSLAISPSGGTLAPI
jgi:hypothetical protein